MTYEKETLGALLSDPRIAPIAADAIRCRDLSTEPIWNKTLLQLREEHIFSGQIGAGFERLFRAADTRDWCYSLYSEEECSEEPARRGTGIVWFPSEDPAADERPFILVVPGGGFVNVWNLTEGWPIGAQFNRLGYHVMILTYQVNEGERLLERNMEDFTRALRFIAANERRFHLCADRYITCGFSAGGYLVCLWNTAMGYPAHDLPAPQATFPVYPVTSLKEMIRYEPEDEDAVFLYGCSASEAARTVYEIPEHVEGFPPCAIFLAAGDELVSPEHSRLLAAALDEKHIPCRMEIGPEGGHGFADGSGMCMDGWTERAVRWYESLSPSGTRAEV